MDETTARRQAEADAAHEEHATEEAIAAEREKWRGLIVAFPVDGSEPARLIPIAGRRVDALSERETVVRYLRAAAAANYRAGDRNAWNAIDLLAAEIERGLHVTTSDSTTSSG